MALLNVMVHWEPNTAQALGEDTTVFNGVEVIEDGDDITLYKDRDLVARFSRHDVAVFLAR